MITFEKAASVLAYVAESLSKTARAVGWGPAEMRQALAPMGASLQKQVDSVPNLRTGQPAASRTKAPFSNDQIKGMARRVSGPAVNLAQGQGMKNTLAAGRSLGAPAVAANTRPPKFMAPRP